jgi:hypothetical protein
VRHHDGPLDALDRPRRRRGGDRGGGPSPMAGSSPAAARAASSVSTRKKQASVTAGTVHGAGGLTGVRSVIVASATPSPAAPVAGIVVAVGRSSKPESSRPCRSRRRRGRRSRVVARAGPSSLSMVVEARVVPRGRAADATPGRRAAGASDADVRSGSVRVADASAAP